MASDTLQQTLLEIIHKSVKASISPSEAVAQIIEAVRKAGYRQNLAAGISEKQGDGNG